MGVVMRCRSIVGITDLRGANVFPTDLADRIVSFLRQDNSALERGAFLAGEGAVFAMQLERVLRDAKNARRRIFRDRREAEAWLGEVLSKEEQRGLNAFLDGGERNDDSPPLSKSAGSRPAPSLPSVRVVNCAEPAPPSKPPASVRRNPRG